MTSSQHFTLLRRALIADAALSGASAVVLVAGATRLEDLLGLPAILLRGAGLCLVPFTALLVYLLRGHEDTRGTKAFRDSLPRGAVWFVVACNALWAIDSLVLLFTGWVDPTALGQAFVVLQALVVAAFAEVQYVALRRSGEHLMDLQRTRADS